jgi:hypothetical protein
MQWILLVVFMVSVVLVFACVVKACCYLFKRFRKTDEPIDELTEETASI